MFSFGTARMMASVWRPIQAMRPNLDSASIKTKRAAKNNRVDHSTLAKTPSIFSLSARMSSSMAPRSAVHPSESDNSGIECRKNTTITNTNVKPDLISSTLSRMGY